MKILVLGSGGREHAIVWKLRQSPRVQSIYCAPGNAGIADLATIVPIPVSDHAALLQYVKEEQIDLTIVGPDEALAAGIVDLFQADGQRIFGPTQSAARLESSKIFAKEFMERHGIPTAHSGSFSESIEAQSFCRGKTYPLVIKADGLALGKGVIIAQNPWEAALAIHEIMDARKFGEAGKRLLIEEFLSGEECSIHALVDGKNYQLWPSAQDHKRALDGNLGLNTGGMGTFSPVSSLVTPAMESRIHREILQPLIDGLAKDNIDYRGMLFPGLMVTADGPKVLEFNCRFGDPETQVLLARLDGDLLELLEATIDRRLADTRPQWKLDVAVCVILASGGYPEKYTSGLVISGLEEVPAGATVFHAGTRRDGDQIVTAGGRVLGVMATAPDLLEARSKAYVAVDLIEFEGRHCRRDIAATDGRGYSSHTL